MAMISKPGRVIVIGGGVSGMTVAVEAAGAGAEVLLVESDHFLGGRMQRMHRYFPRLDSASMGLGIHLRRIKSNPKITELINTTATSITGSRGNFNVTLAIAPEYVNANCTSCNKCVEVCPVEIERKSNFPILKTKAIHAVPNGAAPYTITMDLCKGTSCAKCADVCAPKAINLGSKSRNISVNASSVVVATGWKPYDASRIPNFGFGKIPNVINSMMMERLVAPDGPTGGKIARPSDSTAPAHIAFVQCAGSKDENHLPYCSSVCCMVSLKQAVYIREAFPEACVSIIYTEITNPNPGRYDKFLAQVIDDKKINYINGKVEQISENNDTGGVLLKVNKGDGTQVNIESDMAVLAVGIVPSILSNVLKDVMVLDKNGFMDPQSQKEGIYIAGTAKMPFDVTSSMLDAAGTALRTIQGIRQ
jgi:quinone-modifying oxidoreductase subunit QmoA